MQQIPARSAPVECNRINQVLPLARIVALFAGILDRNSRAEHKIVARYECHSWGDSTERKMVEDIANFS